jgi:hypothetical protein
MPKTNKQLPTVNAPVFLKAGEKLTSIIGAVMFVRKKFPPRIAITLLDTRAKKRNLQKRSQPQLSLFQPLFL